MTTGKDRSLAYFLLKAQQQLSQKGFSSPRKEARHIVSMIGKLGLSFQLANPEHVLDHDSYKRLENALALRLEHRPLQQIAGGVWFDNLWFHVDETVLSPRPETEILVDEAYQYCKKRSEGTLASIAILDTFTGTGAVGISLCHRLRNEQIDCQLSLSDLSAKALLLAEDNARRLLLDDQVHVEVADIWPASADRYDVITANPPYIRSDDIAQLMVEVSAYEPHLALDGGDDGLHFYRRLAEEAANYMHEGAWLFTEVGAGQADAVDLIFTKANWRSCRRAKDLLGHDRVLSFCL